MFKKKIYTVFTTIHSIHPNRFHVVATDTENAMRFRMLHPVEMFLGILLQLLKDKDKLSKWDESHEDAS